MCHSGSPLRRFVYVRGTSCNSRSTCLDHVGCGASGTQYSIVADGHCIDALLPGLPSQCWLDRLIQTSLQEVEELLNWQPAHCAGLKPAARSPLCCRGLCMYMSSAATGCANYKAPPGAVSCPHTCQHVSTSLGWPYLPLHTGWGLWNLHRKAQRRQQA